MGNDQQPVRGFILGSREGRKIDLPGWSMLVKVTAADTLGRVGVVAGRLSPHLPGPAAHIHDGHDETFVVLDGRMRFRVGDRFHTAGPGETVFASRRLAHGFSNPFDEPAGYVVVLTPGGYENYFTKVADHVSRTGTMPDADRTAKLMNEYQTVLAPPICDPDG